MTTVTYLDASALPEGEYAIVEALGHRTLVGRVAEVERFGTKMLQVEPLFDLGHARPRPAGRRFDLPVHPVRSGNRMGTAAEANLPAARQRRRHRSRDRPAGQQRTAILPG
ncbi:hypothetical protein ACFSTD_09620 [Novosphingobium colocasiae]